MVHGWSKDGEILYSIRNDENRRIVLFSFEIASGKERTISDLGPASTAFAFRGFSLAPDGKRIATSIVNTKGDLWLLEGFNKQIGFFERIWKR